VTCLGLGQGYVRMVRSAGMYFTSEAVRYLPNIEEIVEFEALVGGPKAAEGEGGDNGGSHKGGANLSGETVRAARTLDQVVSTLVKNFSEGNDFFRVLLRVFQEVCNCFVAT
jgi:WASH complex subunit 7